MGFPELVTVLGGVGTATARELPDAQPEIATATTAAASTARARRR